MFDFSRTGKEIRQKKRKKADGDGVETEIDDNLSSRGDGTFCPMSMYSSSFCRILGVLLSVPCLSCQGLYLVSCIT